ncbi:Baeyer-Villiger monooxygenase [Ophiocordyceps camponoti-floridani]|uniref:Baeyer-Villiger monooxygenase n=1 Tax=Ophiocordyceps camponoti-floridani TaxID=2030778 RepID=A0A8H4VFQ9_9HYPO|nr:Baeyer-Villiger monooxygenase [Ophiocordyceps camponoti-floridani]
MGDSSSLFGFRTELTGQADGTRNGTDPGLHSGSTPPASDGGPEKLDALIVGAGFAGVFMLKTLRDRGYRVLVYEAGHDLGGTWRWNGYPGAGVDSEVPLYEFSWPEVWRDWTWTTNYPEYSEIRAYFDHVDAVVGIKKDVRFGTVVVGAKFDIDDGLWSVQTADGRTTRTKYLILGTGFAAKRYVPDWPGMADFKGTIHHSSFWPSDKQDQVPIDGKRCGIIGTGASGVQMVQAWAPKAGQLSVFQRTPNLAVPMGRHALTAEAQQQAKVHYPELFRYRERTFSGFCYDWHERSPDDDTAEERRDLLERCWELGGFRIWLCSYIEMMSDEKLNRELYELWLRKTRPRIQDERKRDLLAPVKMPHFFAIKRPCLEETYFEEFNRPTVDVVDVRADPIERFTETGVMLKSGEHHELDVIAIATGFDVSTGAMTQLGLTSIHGRSLQDLWADGAETYLGLTVPGFPNMFHLYGTHAPTLLCNGPSCIEVQGRWIADMIDKAQRRGIKYIDARPEAARAWKDELLRFYGTTLFPTTRSTYMGGNVPGKPFEPVAYGSGLAKYASTIRAVLGKMEGFELVY